MTTFSLGAHNLHDTAGIPTMFADVVLFTEAIPRTVRARLANGVRRATIRATGHRIMVCREQPDLVIVLRRRLFRVTGHGYNRYVTGRPKVTPNRGTYTVETIHRPTGTRVAFDVEHRINAAFPPFIRGEAEFRAEAWLRHYQGTARIISRQMLRGSIVCAGGDLNTPRGVRGYRIPGVTEVGESLDRLASSSRIGAFRYLAVKGSDHPRIRATVTL